MLNKKDWKEYNRQVYKHNELLGVSSLKDLDKMSHGKRKELYPKLQQRTIEGYLDWVANGKKSIVRKLEVISK